MYQVVPRVPVRVEHRKSPQDRRGQYDCNETSEDTSLKRIYSCLFKLPSPISLDNPPPFTDIKGGGWTGWKSQCGRA